MRYLQVSSLSRKGCRAGMLLFIFLTGCLCGIPAQERSLLVKKNGLTIFQTDISDIDSVVFYNPNSMESVPSSDKLVVNKNEGAPAEQITIDAIKKLSFTQNQIKLASVDANTIYPFTTISSLSFKKGTETDLSDQTASSPLAVYITPGREIVVLTDEMIRSLTLLDTQGNLLREGNSNTLSVSLLPAGVYILKVETEQGIIVKKILYRITNR